jgi:DNA-binding MarR family transcriptional regulator
MRDSTRCRLASTPRVRITVSTRGPWTARKITELVKLYEAETAPAAIADALGVTTAQVDSCLQRLVRKEIVRRKDRRRRGQREDHPRSEFRFAPKGLWSEERTRQLIELYGRDDAPREIAKTLGLRADQVHRRLARLASEGRIVRVRKMVSDETIRSVHSAYRKSGDSLAHAASSVGLTGEALRQRFKRLELPTHDRPHERAAAARAERAVRNAQAARSEFIRSTPRGHRTPERYEATRRTRCHHWPARVTLMRHLGLRQWHEVVLEDPPPAPPTLTDRSLTAIDEFLDATRSTPEQRRSITYIRLRAEHNPHWPCYSGVMRVLGDGSFAGIIAAAQARRETTVNRKSAGPPAPTPPPTSQPCGSR